MSMSRIKRLCFMALSNLFYALSYVLFYLDNQITAGGFGGVAIDRKLAVFVNGEAQILVALGFD